MRRGDSRAAVADAILRDVFAALPRDADEATIARACRDAYPWGERAMWPYKVWCARVKAWKATRSKLRAWEGLPLGDVEAEAVRDA